MKKNLLHKLSTTEHKDIQTENSHTDIRHTDRKQSYRHKDRQTDIV